MDRGLIKFAISLNCSRGLEGNRIMFYPFAGTFTFCRFLKLRGDGAIARRRSDQDVSPIRCYPTAWFKALPLLGVQIQLKLIEFGAGQTEMKLICQDNYCYWEWVGVDKDRDQVDKIH